MTHGSPKFGLIDKNYLCSYITKSTEKQRKNSHVEGSTNNGNLASITKNRFDYAFIFLTRAKF